MVVENAQQQRSVGSIVFRQQSVERSSFDSRARVCRARVQVKPKKVREKPTGIEPGRAAVIREVPGRVKGE